MNRDGIIRMAREAGFIVCKTEGALAPMFERFAALVAAAEREACAKLCESKSNDEYATGKVDHNEQAWTDFCANAIRARGKE